MTKCNKKYKNDTFLHLRREDRDTIHNSLLNIISTRK